MIDEYPFEKMIHNLLEKEQCTICQGTGKSWEPVRYINGEFSRTIGYVDCLACKQYNIGVKEEEDDR